MKRQAPLAEEKIARLVETAKLAASNRNYEECYATLERARRMAPTNVILLMFIGRLLVRRYENVKAAEYFDRAIKLSPGKTDILEAAGTDCCNASSYELARQYLESAAAKNDVSGAGLAMLSRTYERLRRMEEADAAAERAIKKDPHNPEAILMRARLDHLMGRNAEAEARLQASITSQIGDLFRVRAAYELGPILDRQGRYDEAMAVFQQAKKIQLQHLEGNVEILKADHARLRALATSLTPDILQRWKDSLPAYSPQLRLAFLGGHPRSGTTLLEQVLDSHPDIVSAEETSVFAEDAYPPILTPRPYMSPILEALELATTEMIQKSRNIYQHRIETFLGQPVGGRLLVDKNPTLMLLTPVLARVFPEIKFLIALRDPRDVCLSSFMLPSGIAKQADSVLWLTLESTIRDYIILIGGWRQLASKLPNPQMEVRYEDVVDNLEPVAHRTLDFLGVPWDPKVLGFDTHAQQKVVRSPTYAAVTKKISKKAVGRWRNYQKYFKPYLADLEPLAKALGYE
jgi:tetratricopeptide (TPR) repeat protein